VLAHDQVFESLRQEDDSPSPVSRFLKGLARGVVETVTTPLDLLRSAAQGHLPTVTRGGEVLPPAGPSFASVVTGSPAGQAAIRTAEAVRQQLPVEGVAGLLGFFAPTALPGLQRGAFRGTEQLLRAVDEARLPRPIDEAILRAVGVFHGSSDPRRLMETGLAGSKAVVRVFDEVANPLIRTTTRPETAFRFSQPLDIGGQEGKVVFRARLRPEAVKEALRFKSPRGQQAMALYGEVGETAPYGAFLRQYPLVDVRAHFKELPFPFSISAAESQIAVFKPSAVKSLKAYYVPEETYREQARLSRLRPGTPILTALLDQAGNVQKMKIHNPRLASYFGFGPVDLKRMR
jgi:hypothetical protein